MTLPPCSMLLYPWRNSVHLYHSHFIFFFVTYVSVVCREYVDGMTSIDNPSPGSPIPHPDIRSILA